MDRSGPVTEDRGVKPESPHLELVPPPADASLIRTALRELHELAAPEGEDRTIVLPDVRWHPSMGARPTPVRRG
jgi:hypothetical protein